MLKILMFIGTVITTGIRLITLVYSSLQESNNLPMLVVITTGILVLFGLYIVARQLLKALLLRELVLFYLVSTVFIVLNLIYVAVALPLQLTPWEGLATGSVLEVLIDLLFLYYSWKQVRSHYVSVDHTLEDSRQKKNKM